MHSVFCLFDLPRAKSFTSDSKSDWIRSTSPVTREIRSPDGFRAKKSFLAKDMLFGYGFHGTFAVLGTWLLLRAVGADFKHVPQSRGHPVEARRWNA